LQQVRNFKYFGCEISCENEKVIQQKPANFSQILGILNNNSKPNLTQKLKKKHTMHWLSPFYYMETKFGPLEKKIENEMNQSR
jgi:hypothetical protein